MTGVEFALSMRSVLTVSVRAISSWTQPRSSESRLAIASLWDPASMLEMSTWTEFEWSTWTHPALSPLG